ncbi:hypothetical protein ACOME3_001852 [Neoechinorhynchus agilis]
MLQRCYRNQSFKTWLCLLNCQSRVVYPLCCIQWGFRYDLEVDSTKPLGQRVINIDSNNESPRVIDCDPPTENVLNGPCANEMMRLVAYPCFGFKSFSENT